MSTEADKLDLLWGVEAIADTIGRSQRQTFHMLNQGQLPGKKIGDRWVVSRRKLVEFFESEAA